MKSFFAKAMCLPHSRQHSFCNTVLDAVHTDHKLESVGAKSTVALITRLGEKSKREAAARDLERFAANLRFVPFAAFKANGCVPRFGAAPDFKHPLSKRGNDNLCIPLHKFDREKTAFIFVSHRWLTPRPGAAGHPDDVDTHCKHELICEAVARLKGPNSPIPENFKVALWMDFSCVNQDGAPAAELEERMAALIGVCDLLLTPVADSDHASWKLPISFNNAIEDYQAPAWREYWRRAWCRVEAFLAAVVPVESYQERARLFRGGMNVALSAGRRPQVIFGHKEVAENRPPLFLPPMLNTTFHKYAPAKGNLTSEGDRPVIIALTETARRHVHDDDIGYQGERNAQGEPHGNGRCLFDDGGVYDGEWADGAQHGTGTYLWSWGDSYTGGWQRGKKHGQAVHTYADGGKFVGAMADDMRNGYGRFKYGHGDEYDGYYVNDLKDYGIWAYVNGEMRVCRWVLHESGSYSVIQGEGVKWDAERTAAWRLVDGELREEISLEEAAAISARVGTGMPTSTPPPYVPRKESKLRWDKLRTMSKQFSTASRLAASCGDGHPD